MIMIMIDVFVTIAVFIMFLHCVNTVYNFSKLSSGDPTFHFFRKVNFNINISRS